MIIGVGTDSTLLGRDSVATWTRVQDSGYIRSAAVLSDGVIVGVDMDGELCTRATLTASWSPSRGAAP